ALFLRLHPLPEDVLILRVRLRQVVIPEALAIGHVRAPLRVAFDGLLDAPDRVVRRARPPATEILLVLDLQRADVTLECAQFLVNFVHMRCRAGTPILKPDGGRVNRRCCREGRHRHPLRPRQRLCCNGVSMPPREHDSGALLRSLPSLDELLRPPVLEAARAVLDRLRAEISRGAVPAEGHLEAEALEAAIRDEAARDTSFSLRAVINATGVVLHTNLGRAPIGAAALARLAEAASGYSNLEYDLAAGARGKRDVHTARPLARVLGAEAALVVNNNAAAVFLALHALARGGEVLVSRGELIEIGDGFRIPDIMASSGAVLREVGTTNRTHLADYEAAIGSETRLLMSVHP